MVAKPLTLAVMIALAISGFAWGHSSNPVVSAVTITRPGAENFGGPFSLIDQSGRHVSNTDYRGTPMLIYFGYTNCTDACPLDALAIGRVVDVLDHRGLAVVPVFITVDPERDTPARLKEFLSAFHPRFVGLTGPVDRVISVATAYGASGEGDRFNEKPDGRYDVLHASVAYLIGRRGELLDIIHLREPHELTAERITKLVDAAAVRR